MHIYLELLPNAEDLVDEVLNTDDVLLAKLLFYDCVGGEWHALAVHLRETALVYQLERIILLLGLSILNQKL